MKYLRYWGLNESPFRTPPFFAGAAQRRVIAGVNDLVLSEESFACLVGPKGAGKTTLLRRLSNSSGIGDAPVQVVYSQAARTAETSEVLELVDHNSLSGIHTVWLIDHANSVLLQRVRSMRPAKMMTILVAASRSLAKTLRLPGIETGVLDQQETKEFLRRSLYRVGRNLVFSESAVRRLQQETNGYIGQIARQAEKALIVGAVNKRNVVSSADVAMACECESPAATQGDVYASDGYASDSRANKKAAA